MVYKTASCTATSLFYRRPSSNEKDSGVKNKAVPEHEVLTKPKSDGSDLEASVGPDARAKSVFNESLVVRAAMVAETTMFSTRDVVHFQYLPLLCQRSSRCNQRARLILKDIDT